MNDESVQIAVCKKITGVKGLENRSVSIQALFGYCFVKIAHTPSVPFGND